MRIALLSDIHGNTIALDAVLADIQRQGVDEYWLLGDYVAIGHDPLGALERLSKLPNAHFIHGNTDRYVTSDESPKEWIEGVKNDINQLPQLVAVTKSMAWTCGAISVGGWFDWLSALPLEQRTTLPNGTLVLGVHASPGTDDGEGMQPVMSDEKLWELFKGCEADLVFVGHTHFWQDRAVNNVRIVNLGSVSNPLPPDLRASYIILNADAKGYTLEHRLVNYDHEAVIAAMHKIKHPAASYVELHMRGKRLPSWEIKK